MQSRPTSSAFIASTAFTASLLLLLLTFADAVSAVNQTTVTSSPAMSTGRRNASSHLPFTPGPPPSFKLSTNGFSATRTTSDVVPSTQSSQRAIQIITSGIPPLLRSSTASGYRQLTSPPVSIAGGEVIHCQVKLANGYHETLNASGSARRVYGRELGAGIARLCQVDDTRISDVNVVEDPDTGLMVLRFSINPPVTSCRIGCFVDTSQVADTAERLVNSLSFNLTDISSQTLYVQQLPAFYSWTDDGPCPNSTCPDDKVCSVRLSGEFFCQCAKDCLTGGTTDSSNSALWALFVIPFVIIIVLLVLLILIFYNRRQNIKNKIGAKTVRDYKPAYDIETLKKEPMLATLDPGVSNQLFKSLGSQLGIAFNDRSFDNASCSGDTLVSPRSTVRAFNTVSTRASPLDDDDI